MGLLNQRVRFSLLLLPVLFLIASQLRAALCDTSNSNLICNVEHLNGVAVTHYRVNGTTSAPRAWVWLQDNFPTIFGTGPHFYSSVALLVGVVDYAHLQQLPGVRNDIARMRDYLLTQEEFDDVYVLQNEDVTTGAVNNLMFGYFNRAEKLGEQDRFLFYYSGHGSNQTGVGQMQFGQADPNPQQYNADANLPVSTWKDWGNAIQAKQALFLFDACALGGQIEKGERSETDPELLRKLTQDKSRIAFAATRGGEAAQGNEDSSYFTLEFLRVVESGKADIYKVGFMTIATIAELMQQKLGQLAHEHGYKFLYTTPKGLDEASYPGTFVFLNPRVPRDAESKFSDLTGHSTVKGTETPSTGSQIGSTAKKYLDHGTAAESKKDYDTAISDFTEVIRRSPRYAWSYAKRGEAYMKRNNKGDLDKAIDDFTEDIRQEQTYISYFHRGSCWYFSKNYDKAISDFTEAIRQQLETPGVEYYNRGGAYLKNGDYDKAINDFTEAIRPLPPEVTKICGMGPEDKRYDDGYYAAAYYHRGEARYYKKDYITARSDYEKAIRLNALYGLSYYDQSISTRRLDFVPRDPYGHNYY
jgi:Tfp pilus assembly protein PilF